MSAVHFAAACHVMHQQSLLLMGAEADFGNTPRSLQKLKMHYAHFHISGYFAPYNPFLQNTFT